MLHQIKVGDHVLAYQTDTEAAIGLCRIDRLINRARGERQMIVKPIERFAVPVKLHNLKKTDPQLRRVRALRQGPVAALYPTSPQEARVLLRACRTATTPTAGPAARKGKAGRNSAKAMAESIARELKDLPAATREHMFTEVKRAIRDQRFRPLLLRHWDHACAACGLALSAESQYEVQAAHVWPVEQGGFDQVKNGMPLCRTHHWAYDHYLWAVNPRNLRIQVHPSLKGEPGLADIVDTKLRLPRRWKSSTRRGFLENLERAWRRFQSGFRIRKQA